VKLQPQLTGVTLFGKELINDHRSSSSGLNLTFEGLLLGASLHLCTKPTLSDPPPPPSGDSKLVTPSYSEGRIHRVCKKLKVSKVSKRMSRQPNTTGAFGDTKMEVVSQKCHANHHLKAIVSAPARVNISLEFCEEVS
jgi:hypothetical protein